MAYCYVVNADVTRTPFYTMFAGFEFFCNSLTIYTIRILRKKILLHVALLECFYAKD